MLMLIAPLAFKKFAKGHFVTVLLVSFFLWCLGQIRTTDIIVGFFKNYIPISIGNFDLLSWQLIFFIGFFLGFQEGNKQLEPFKNNTKVFLACLFFASILFVVRHEIVTLPEIPYFGSLISKQYVGIIRLFNFLILCYIVCYLVDRYKSLFRWTWLIFLGKHSLQVFSFHVLLLTIFLPFIDEYNHMALLSKCCLLS